MTFDHSCDIEEIKSTPDAVRSWKRHTHKMIYLKALVMIAAMGTLMLCSGLPSHDVRHRTTSSPFSFQKEAAQGKEAPISIVDDGHQERSYDSPPASDVFPEIHGHKNDEKHHAMTRQLVSNPKKFDKIKAVTIRSYSSGNYLNGRNPGDSGVNKVHLTNRDPDGDKYLQWLFIPVGNGDKVAIRSVSSGLYMAGRNPDQTGAQVNLRNADINDIYVQWEIIRYGNTYAIRSMSSRNYLDGRNPEHTGPQLFLTNRNPSGDKYLKWMVAEIDYRDDVIESAAFNRIWASSPNQIMRRKCPGCIGSHKDIYYRRFDKNGLPDGFDLLDTVKNNWNNGPGNSFNVDFKLYSTYI